MEIRSICSSSTPAAVDTCRRLALALLTKCAAIPAHIDPAAGRVYASSILQESIYLQDKHNMHFIMK